MPSGEIEWWGIWCWYGWMVEKGCILFYPAKELAEAHAAQMREFAGDDYEMKTAEAKPIAQWKMLMEMQRNIRAKK